VTATTPLRHFATLDSTNTEAHRQFQSGEQGPLWLLADEQTGGKGRLQRNWVSARGNCYSTLLLPLAVKAEAVSQLGFVVALAVLDCVASKAPAATVQLKWPNDVLVGGAKISGILCEVLSAAPLVVAIGCGINVAHAPMGLPYPATCLAAESGNANRDDVFLTYQNALSLRLAQWNNGENFKAIRTAWLANAIGLGETVSMQVGEETITGSFDGLTEQGAIILKPVAGPPRILHAGDLTIPSLSNLRSQRT
jgi:BirA family transcriptional regulator, biotin operon repressor / biotin---[acetyl-CoA-carboxylase] ligase